MNKLVLSALAATVCVGTTNANESDWAGLDAELTALTTSMVKDGPTVSGYLEATYDSDAENWGVGRNVVTVSGNNGGYGYHVDLQGSEGLDAFVTFTMGGMGWTMGTFMKPGTAADAEAENDRVFSTREFEFATVAGFNDGTRSNGLMASGSMDALGYQIYIGDDPLGGRNELAFRLTYDVMSGEGVNLSVAYSMDDGLADSSAIEADLSSGPFGIHLTQRNYGLIGVDPTCITASYDINDTWSIAIRSTDADITGVEDRLDWALTYADGGARWTIEALDTGAADNDTIGIGCLVGF